MVLFQVPIAIFLIRFMSKPFLLQNLRPYPSATSSIIMIVNPNIRLNVARSVLLLA